MTRPHKYFIAEPEAVTVFPDGRECCNKNAAGKREYLARTVELWERQEGLCPICGNWIELRFAQMDHQNGRGANGKHRDDRTIVNGKWHNSALHGICNTRKGSERYHWVGKSYQPVPSKVVIAKEVA